MSAPDRQPAPLDDVDRAAHAAADAAKPGLAHLHVLPERWRAEEAHYERHYRETFTAAIAAKLSGHAPCAAGAVAAIACALTVCRAHGLTRDEATAMVAAAVDLTFLD